MPFLHTVTTCRSFALASSLFSGSNWLGATVQNKNNLRDDTLEGYAAALRWGDFQSAWNFVDPAVRAAHPLTDQQKALYNTVRVAEYDASGPMAAGPDTIEQTATIGLIVKSSQRVYSVLDHQT